MLHRPEQMPAEALESIWMAGVVEPLINSLDESAPHLVECKSVLSRHEVFIVPLVEWPIEQMEILSDQSGWPITVATIIMDWITESSSAYLSENMSILSCPELLSAIDE